MDARGIRLPGMSTRATYIIAAGLSLLTLLVGIFYYGVLPAEMASHWDASGAVDGTMPRFWGVFLLPVLMLLLSALLVLIPRIDPLRENIERFRLQYNVFVALTIAILGGIQLAALAANLGIRFNMTIVVMPLIGFLFLYIGLLLPETRRNFFLGIRTPWTLSSDEVWLRTHRLGGTLFKLLGVLAIGTIVAPQSAVIVFLVPLAVAVCGIILYSYVVYREIETRSL